VSAGPGLQHSLESGFAGGEGIVGKSGQTDQLLLALLVGLEGQAVFLDLAQKLLCPAPVRGGFPFDLKFLQMLLQRENKLFK